MRIGVWTLFLFCASAGYWISTHSWQGTVYVYLGDTRAPASVRALDDYSPVNRDAFFAAAHQQLLSSAETLHRNGYVGLRLGHPLLPTEPGGKMFACQVQGRTGLFDRVELTFWGVGVSVSGDAPRLIVDTECSAESEDIGLLQTIWIPMQSVIAAGARDQELEFLEQNPIYIRLEHMPDEWPKSWMLHDVRFYRITDPDDSLSLGMDQIRSARPELLFFDTNGTQ